MTLMVPDSLEYTVRNIDNHMTAWKVIALVSGNSKPFQARLLRTGLEPTNGRCGKGLPLTKLKRSNVRRKPIPGLTLSG
ncbi:MAG: hypothetical protein ABSF71_35365 [Terriglobia bacterium]|jgi:hypothetical protein